MQTITANTREHLAVIGELFVEYAKAIEVDLCFQSFDQELAGLPGRYAAPEGRLFLAMENDQPAGCVALRQIGDGICEMKRLYVRPAFRRRGLGRALATVVITAAREIGYVCMRLDTPASMKQAIRLYESLGFRRIAPYYGNPGACVIFMELDLN
jgi:putative acetyltransferase